MVPPPDETPKSLGDGVTGSDVGPPEESSAQSLGDGATGSDVGSPGTSSDQSLGDQSTTGDVGSSVSDLLDLGEDFGEGTDEIVDLEARYEIKSTLGQGGMGEVVLAQDKRLNRQVAIKRLREELGASRRAAQRFLTEAQSVAALNHFNIVQIYDYGRAADGPFIVMEYVGGGSLAETLEGGALDLERVIALGCQLCEAIGVAHRAGIIHRDIKPANVLMTAEGVPKLTDFGLARQETVDGGQTQAGAVLGTLDFMPPEQKVDASQADARSDLWSLGATFYQMATGRNPRVIRLNELSGDLQEVLGKALEDSPSDRYQTAEEFREALRAMRPGESTATPTDVLAEGECGSCGTENDPTRKFCKECATALRVACLSCEQQIPVWDKVCGECGGKQEDLLLVRQSAMQEQCDEAEVLSRQFEYVRARKIAEQIQSEPDGRLQQLNEWSVAFLESLENEEAVQRKRVAGLLAEAKQKQAADDYVAAVHVLEGIPEPLRGREISSLFAEMRSTAAESEQLLATIRERIQARELKGLQEKVTRALALHPGREDLQKIQAQLEEREKRLSQRRDLAFSKAEELLGQGNAKQALAMVTKVEDAGLNAAQNALKSQLNDIVGKEKWLAASMKAARADGEIHPDKTVQILLASVEYLSLNPRHQNVKKLQEQLVARINQSPGEYLSFLRGVPGTVLAELSENVRLELHLLENPSVFQREERQSTSTVQDTSRLSLDSHVVTEPCFNCKYTDCVVVCPVECFYEGESMLYIHPDECIDCEACVPECPVEAIFQAGNVPEHQEGFIQLNAEMCNDCDPPLPVIYEKQTPLADQ